MIRGLSNAESKKLLAEYGTNSIEEKYDRNVALWFLGQFKDTLSILLFVAAGLSFFISNLIDALLILTIVIINAIFKLYQEVKAEKAISTLKHLTITTARVIREGKEMELDSRFLVPGDIVKIEEGGKIPADGKILESINLEINEASLTGESMLIYKGVNESVFMGTIVLKGRAIMQITGTGMNTEFGQIARSLSSIDRTATPFQRKLNGLLRLIGLLGVVIAFFVIGISLIQGASYLSSVILAIALAVAILPEGLPAVTTITLALGVKEMAKRNTIVRRLESIESIGSVTLIATDKTGTLTNNDMRVSELFIDNKIYTEDNFPDINNQTFSKLITNAVLCSTASLISTKDGKSWEVLGDPTEGALLLLAQRVGVNPELQRKEWTILKEVPFDSLSKTMSVIVKSKDSKEMTFLKGAPETVFDRCEKIIINGKEELLTNEKKKHLQEVFNNWTEKGLRVLAFSYSGSPEVFIGMVAMQDSLRPEAKGAVEKAHKAGIKVIMITGDNEKTAESVGVGVGIISNGDFILTGNQIEKLTDEELLEKLPKIKIFARTNPLQKSRIVSLYQRLGEVIAVTGDGVNDVVALKQADVGVAMGKIGTDVARETSDIIIMDDNFATIVIAIEEGRHIVRNLKNAVKYQLSTNMSEGLALILGLTLGISNLFFAVQILYVNLISDGIPALALAFSPRENHLMDRHPDKKMQLIKKFDLIYILLVAFMATIIIVGSYFVFRIWGETLGKTAAFSVLAIIQSFVFVDLWLSHRSVHKNIKDLLSPLFLLAFILPIMTQFFITQIPAFAHVFKIETVPVLFFFMFIAVSAVMLVGVGAIKKLIA